eukprot:COSAG04_NODE_629_length_11765_cov_11.121721_6_plen_43_part_00
MCRVWGARGLTGLVSGLLVPRVPGGVTSLPVAAEFAPAATGH